MLVYLKSILPFIIPFIQWLPKSLWVASIACIIFKSLLMSFRHKLSTLSQDTAGTTAITQAELDARSANIVKTLIPLIIIGIIYIITGIYTFGWLIRTIWGYFKLTV